MRAPPGGRWKTHTAVARFSPTAQLSNVLAAGALCILKKYRGPQRALAPTEYTEREGCMVFNIQIYGLKIFEH